VRSSRVARIASAAGAVIAVAGGAFLIRVIVNEWSAVRSTLADAQPAWLVAGFLCAAVAMVSVALPWRVGLTMVGATLDRGATVAAYFVGEVGKYVPGGIWPVVGRAELVRRGGVSRARSYASVALSLGALYLAGMLVVALLVPVRFASDDGAAALWVLVLLPVGVLALHPRPLGWVLERAERMVGSSPSVRVPPWSASIGLVVRYIPSWLLVGTATWCVARAFDRNVGWTAVAPAAVLSWVVGFVLVPIPGGIGVREAVFVALVGTLPSGVAATVAVTARLCFVLVDGGGAALGALSWRRFGPRLPPAERDHDALKP
jgi:glycosyltransferase 2 family protein